MASLNDVPGAAILVDDSLVVQDANSRAELVFREPAEDIVGRSIDSYRESGLLEESAVDAWKADIDSVRNGGTDEVTTTITVTPANDGSWKYDLHVQSLSGGTVQCSFRSVGTRRRYEKTVTALHAATRRLMTAESVDDVLRRTAESTHEVLGFPGTGVRRYDPEEDALSFVAFGSRVNKVSDRPPRSVEDSPQGEAYRTGKTVIDKIEHERGTDPYDRSSFTETMYVPIGETGVLSIGTVGNRFDETDVHFAEILAENAAAAITVVSTTESLRAERERLDRFASMVSHDLRNPLNMAQTYLELARETGNDEYIANVGDAHERMGTMIEELLALARMETEVDESDLEAVVLSSLLEESWEAVPADGATLETDVPSSLTIDAHPDIFRNVLENLLRNAVDHNDPPVTVTVGTVGDEGFYVEDDGSGIPESRRDAVFEYGHTTSKEGTGFGLSIAREFVAAHDWDISVTESEVGGARFEITGVGLDR